MAKIWEERIVGYYSYFEEDDKRQAYGDVRTVQPDYTKPVNYMSTVYTPPPGSVIGTFSTLQDAKEAVQQECVRQGL